ncbi:TetR family transcriptional regulator [Saccharothrix sp. ALI-22-I]|uniref:TetR/AcrR family transcriptional regulator n=1 Tax=Saccharothrix sp. ALI-22-I TaxID=1933778 RepID=UPI00097BCC63|nr:TetR/AcrR family transcriptional regulator [Saccharothrix sp. ALI-22-I]ONI84638.1 TetR family transcriptional regulator [Saccharothrix sp. ALI-22-I]
MRRSAAQTREHVLAITHDLFYWHGIRAVGVDRVAAEAGVAPTTLYRLFASKDDLVAAYVARAGESYRAWFGRATEADGRDPRERLLAAFDELIAQVQPERSRGCPFLMVLSEFPDRELPAHRNAIAMKNWVRESFGELTAELAATHPVEDPDELADELVLVMEGVYASVQALGVDGPARRARDLVDLLLPRRADDMVVSAGGRHGAA